MLNVTIKFAVYCLFFLFLGCTEAKKEGPDLEILHRADSASEARIDSAYTVIRQNCDTLVKYKASALADSLLKDSLALKKYFDSTALFSDADQKVQQVIRQLQADCDSNLQRETYRIVQHRKRSAPAPRRKPKVLPAARHS